MGFPLSEAYNLLMNAKSLVGVELGRKSLSVTYGDGGSV